VSVVHEAGDYTVRSNDLVARGIDAAFSGDTLSDTALTAAYRTAAKFSAHFPGWFLYRRVMAGTNLFDRQLEAWAVTSARMLSRSLKDNGRDYIGPKTRQKPLWVAQAGRDALDFAIFGRYAEGLHERADRFGVAHKTYQAIRDPVGKSMWIGLETFRAQLHAEYWHVREDERRI
jgi:hypothetical protein